MRKGELHTKAGGNFNSKSCHANSKMLCIASSTLRKRVKIRLPGLTWVNSRVDPIPGQGANIYGGVLTRNNSLAKIHRHNGCHVKLGSGVNFNIFSGCRGLDWATREIRPWNPLSSRGEDLTRIYCEDFRLFTDEEKSLQKITFVSKCPECGISALKVMIWRKPWKISLQISFSPAEIRRKLLQQMQPRKA